MGGGRRLVFIPAAQPQLVRLASYKQARPARQGKLSQQVPGPNVSILLEGETPRAERGPCAWLHAVPQVPTRPNVRSFWRPVQCQSGRRQWAGSEQAADGSPIHLKVLTECTHGGVSTGKSQLGDASQSIVTGAPPSGLVQSWSSSHTVPASHSSGSAGLSASQSPPVPPIPTTAQSRMSRPAHSPAGIATHQSPTAQGPRGSRGPLAGEQENPRGAAGVAKGEGGTLPALSQGPFVSPSRANLRAPIVRTARRSAGVAVRNRMTWVFFQRLCVRVFVAHGRTLLSFVHTYVFHPGHNLGLAPRWVGSARSQRVQCYKELPRSSRSHLEKDVHTSIHGTWRHWRRTAPSRSGAAWPTGHCPWQKLDRRQRRDGAFIPWGVVICATCWLVGRVPSYAEQRPTTGAGTVGNPELTIWFGGFRELRGDATAGLGSVGSLPSVIHQSSVGDAIAAIQSFDPDPSSLDSNAARDSCVLSASFDSMRGIEREEVN